MFLLPPPAHPIRELFEVADLVPFGQRRPEKLPPVRWELRRNAMRFLEANPAARRVVGFVLCADDSVRLASVGRRGGIKLLWNFGRIEA
jgi:hypothetical protein